MKHKLQNLIKSGILTLDEAIEYLAQIAESYDSSGLHIIADTYWHMIKEL